MIRPLTIVALLYCSAAYAKPISEPAMARYAMALRSAFEGVTSQSLLRSNALTQAYVRSVPRGIKNSWAVGTRSLSDSVRLMTAYGEVDPAYVEYQKSEFGDDGRRTDLIQSLHKFRLYLFMRLSSNAEHEVARVIGKTSASIFFLVDFHEAASEATRAESENRNPTEVSSRYRFHSFPLSASPTKNGWIDPFTP